MSEFNSIAKNSVFGNGGDVSAECNLMSAVIVQAYEDLYFVNLMENEFGWLLELERKAVSKADRRRFNDIGVYYRAAAENVREFLSDNDRADGWLPYFTNYEAKDIRRFATIKNDRLDKLYLRMLKNHCPKNYLYRLNNSILNYTKKAA